MCGELYLRTRMTASHQRVDNRKTEMPGQLERLVESTLIFAAPMQWDWNSAAPFVQQFRSPAAHAHGEGSCNRPSTTVLESMNEIPQCSLVFANSTRSVHDSHAISASKTSLLSRQRIPTAVADRRCDWPNRCPAGSTHTSRQRLIENLGAHGAYRGQ